MRPLRPSAFRRGVRATRASDPQAVVPDHDLDTLLADIAAWRREQHRAPAIGAPSSGELAPRGVLR